MDHQRRVCRHVHHICAGGWQAIQLLHRREDYPGVSTGAEENKMGLARLVDTHADSEQRADSNRQRRWRNRQRPSRRVQHPEYRPRQAGSRRGRRSEDGAQRRDPVCQAANRVRKAHRQFWRHQTQARGDGDPDLGRGRNGLSNRRPHGSQPRRHRHGQCCAKCSRRSKNTRSSVRF